MLLTNTKPINNAADIHTKNDFAQICIDKIKNIYKYINSNSNNYNRNRYKYINQLTNSNQTFEPIPYVNIDYIEQLLQNITFNVSIDNRIIYSQHIFIPIYCLIINHKEMQYCISSNHFTSFLRHAIFTPKIKQPTTDANILSNYRTHRELTFHLIQF